MTRLPFLLLLFTIQSVIGCFPIAGAADAVPVVMASGLLRQCLGITPGAPRMVRGAATQAFCRQLPANDLYDQAGARFQAGDHAGAAQLVTRSAEAGNPIAQLRLALLYDQGDGVKQSARTALQWYLRAAAQGEPESQHQVALFYELGQGVPEDWGLSARLLQASAGQGWVKGQFAYGRAFQFGIGVAQNRQQAIAWFQRAAAQGDARGDYWAKWLRDSTNNIGFRDDVERGAVMAGKLRFGASLMGADPAGIPFHNSAQRALWILGLANAVDRDEAEVFRDIRKREYDDCRSAGRDNCAPARL